jgi:sugar-specific transcriptional regulator TrmB
MIRQKGIMQNPKTILQELGLSESEIAVYLTMLSGAGTARDIIKSTQMKRPTVYYALTGLEKRGLISKTGSEGKRRFFPEPLHKLTLLVDEKLADAQTLKADIAALLPSLSPAPGSREQRPTVSFFEGKLAVQRTIMDMLYCKSKQINSVVPTDNFFWQTGKEFAKSFIEQRVKRGIKTKNLWEATGDKTLVKQYYGGLSEIRILPDVMKGRFRTAIFLYEDKVLYVSSLKNAYCVLMTSQEHHETMQAWFDGLWLASTPLKNKA